MTELEIKIPASKQGSYKIVIGTDILGNLWQQIMSDFQDRSMFVITDENLVEAGHLQTLLPNKDVPYFVISPAGETSKHINTVVAIIEDMEKACLGRDSLVVALGGGTVGDIAGFAAAIFKRGVSVVQIPTTSLAQADSAVGGKTGVDSTVSKNAFGAFWHPAAVYIDVATLSTLDDRHYRAGLVESIKHAIIADAEYFNFIENNIDAIIDRVPDALEKLAASNCRIKGAVVQADPNEKNQRRMLNYGHTIGHAVESLSGYSLLHGEAIAIGIIAAGMIEIKMGLSNPEKLERITSILEKINVPVALPTDLDENKIIDLLRHDKKAVGKWPKFVLTNDIGSVHQQDGQWAVDVEKELVVNILTKIGKVKI